MSRRSRPRIPAAAPLDPRGERRVELMLEAAIAEFSSKGWRNARLGDIVARSRVGGLLGPASESSPATAATAAANQ